MDPITITCDVCGRTTFVHKVRYKYAEDGEPAKDDSKAAGRGTCSHSFAERMGGSHKQDISQAVGNRHSDATS